MDMCGPVKFMDSAPFPGVKLEIRRYVLALQWMRDNIESLSPCSQILIVDARDTIFQRDPFAELHRLGAASALLSLRICLLLPSSLPQAPSLSLSKKAMRTSR